MTYNLCNIAVNKKTKKKWKIRKYVCNINRRWADKKYFDLEVNFNVMIVDINKIIAESIKGVL